MHMPKVPLTDSTQPTTCAFAALTAAEGPTTSEAGRPVGSTVSQICLKDMSVLKAQSAELMGMLLSERH
jgi:hypothetical protein